MMTLLMIVFVYGLWAVLSALLIVSACILSSRLSQRGEPRPKSSMEKLLEGIKGRWA